MGRGFDEQKSGTENRPDGNKRKWRAAVSAGILVIRRLKRWIALSDGLGWTRTGGTAGAGVPLNADSRHMASERNFAFLPDSSHMADSRKPHGRRSADKRQTVGRGAQDQ